MFSIYDDIGLDSLIRLCYCLLSALFIPTCAINVYPVHSTISCPWIHPVMLP